MRAQNERGELVIETKGRDPKVKVNLDPRRLRQIRDGYWLRLAEAGLSWSQIAELAGVARSTVGRRLKQLEAASRGYNRTQSARGQV